VRYRRGASAAARVRGRIHEAVVLSRRRSSSSAEQQLIAGGKSLLLLRGCGVHLMQGGVRAKHRRGRRRTRLLPSMTRCESGGAAAAGRAHANREKQHHRQAGARRCCRRREQQPRRRRRRRPHIIWTKVMSTRAARSPSYAHIE
jgi:hypothetical protein